MRVDLATINNALRRVGLLLIVGAGPDAPTFLELITVRTWNARISRQVAARGSARA